MKFTFFIAAIASVSAVTLNKDKVIDINYDSHLDTITSGTTGFSNNDAKIRSDNVGSQEKADAWRAVKPAPFGP